jgi:predicted metal-dependent phosphotriesterase family hydrolase
MFIASLLRNGLTEEEVNYMVKINPAKLLGLKPQ